MESIHHFLRGVLDSLRFPKAIHEIIMSPYLTYRTFQCVIINGGIYLGSVILYNIVVSTLFVDSSSTFFKALYFITSIIYQIWLLMVYLAAMILTTIWVQDIYDETSIIKLKRIIKASN